MLSFYALVGGLSSLTGWVLDLPRLTDWDGNGISIQPNATVAVTCSGAALIMLACGRKRVAMILGVVVALIGASTLFQYLSGVNLEFLNTLLMFDRPWGRGGVVHPGRMGPPGAACWTLIGTSLVLVSINGPFRNRRAIPVLAVLTLGISMLSITGYFYGVDMLYSLPHLTVIALQTATFIAAISIAIIAAVPEHAPMRWLLAGGAAGDVARRAAPTFILLPLVIGWLIKLGEAWKLYDSHFAAAMLVLALMALLLALLGWNLATISRHEKALRQSEHRLLHTLESITDGFVTLDRDWNYNYVNEEAERLLQRSRVELLGRNAWDAFPESVGRTSYLELHRVANERCSTHFEDFNPVLNRWFGVRAYPMQDGGVAAYFQDITGRKQAEEQLRRSTELLTFVIDRCPTGFYIVDANFCISHINADEQARAFRNVQPAIGRRLDDAMRVLWPEPLATELIAIFRHTLDTGEPYCSPGLMSARADLETVETYEWQLDRIAMPDGTYGVVCYFYDTTRLREAETQARALADQLRQYSADLSDADRRKNEFLATLAHELRNPLAPLRNGLQIIRLSGGSRESVEQTRGMMERQLEQMVRLVDDLLDVSRITRDKLELRRERVDLATVLNNAVETSRPLLEASVHKLTVIKPSQPVFVDADVTRLGQVFANLLNNAAKYSERGGHIRLTVEPQGSDVVISVMDTGVGIPAAMLPRIFDLFIQVDRSLEKSQGGLGIGLTLVKRLVDMHGGSVDARSDGHEKGSEFVVRLPLLKDEGGRMKDESETNEVQPSISVSQPPKCRILVADDNVDSAMSLALMLQIMGNDVRTAHDGLQAVAVAETFRPEVILLDIGMPKMNGYEACRRIREQAWGENTMLIALTGWGQDEDRRRSEEAGFNHHMVKPVDPMALGQLLRGVSSGTAPE